MSTGKLVVGITGASGAILAQRFLIHALSHYDQIFLCLSKQAPQVAQVELGIQLNINKLNIKEWLGNDYPQIQLMNNNSFFSPPASGSFRHDGMVIIPCSMGTIGRIANGISQDLLTRAADVCLKEQRKLVVVPREMPWNLIMLRNLTRLAEAGATVLPACPAWYHAPKTIEDLADSVVARVLQNLGVEQNIFKQWMIEE